MLFEREKASASALQVEIWFVCFIIPGSVVIRPKGSIEDLPKANSRLEKSKGGGGGKPTLQMFCLQNTQMFVCVLNSRTNIGC